MTAAMEHMYPGLSEEREWHPAAGIRDLRRDVILFP